LRQPGRREGFQVARELVGADLAAQPLHGLEDRQIGLAVAVELYALGMGDRGAHRRGRRGEEDLDQRALADAGLAGDEYGLPGAIAGFLERGLQDRQLVAAADELLDGRRRRLRREFRTRNLLHDFFHGGDDTEAAAADGADEALLGAVVAQRLADRLDAAGGRGV